MNTAKPHWLFASSSTAERLEVLRSPLVGDNDDWLEPVQRFIHDNGLVLSARENFVHPHFMWGQADASVYVSPAARYAGGIELIPTTDGFAGTTPGVLATSARGHVTEHWPFPPEAEEADDLDPMTN
ncbi:MAG: hypothetical protein JWR34_3911 [Mycobacterium sp.]|nr:hypothetical protein [Mycobacterium sp.]